MVIRKDILRDCGGFDVRVGMHGNTLRYGEDTEVLMKIHLKGHEIFYVHLMQVSHLIADYKLNLSWLLRSYYLKGRSIDHVLHREIGVLEHAARLAASLILGSLMFFKPVPMPFKRRIFYLCRYGVYQTGAFVSSWKK